MILIVLGCGMGLVLVGDVEYCVVMVFYVKNVNVEFVFDFVWFCDMMSEEVQFEVGLFFQLFMY